MATIKAMFSRLTGETDINESTGVEYNVSQRFYNIAEAKAPDGVESADLEGLKAIDAYLRTKSMALAFSSKAYTEDAVKVETDTGYKLVSRKGDGKVILHMYEGTTADGNPFQSFWTFIVSTSRFRPISVPSV